MKAHRRGQAARRGALAGALVMAALGALGGCRDRGGGAGASASASALPGFPSSFRPIAPQVAIELVVDDQRVYWSTCDAGDHNCKLLAAEGPGSAPRTITPLPRPTRGLVAGAQRLYWLDAGGGLMSVPKTGGAAEKLTDTSGAARGPKVSGDVVVWSEREQVFRLPPGGQKKSLGTVPHEVSALETDREETYVLSNETGQPSRLYMLHTEGGPPRLLLEQKGPPGRFLTQDEKYLYWLADDCVHRMSKHGGTVEQTICRQYNSPRSHFQIEGGQLFFATENRLTRCSAGGPGSTCGDLLTLEPRKDAVYMTTDQVRSFAAGRGRVAIGAGGWVGQIAR